MNNLDSTNKTSANYALRGQEKPQILQLNTCTGNETVLLIQDISSWGSYADAIELQAQGINFCTISSDQIESIDLSRFKEIVIPSAQTPEFYQNLMPGGVITPSIEAFVGNGGVLSANLAWAESYAAGATFVGGLKYQFYYTDSNSIVNSSHPIITGALPCFGGNCGQIVDVGYKNDIDGWNYSSHAYFTNFPAETVVILADENNNPVMIEYPFGRGKVIVNFNTLEWRYDVVGNEKKLLANELAYQSYLVRQQSRGLIVEV